MNSITIQREQARAVAVRDAELCAAMAAEYHFWQMQVEAVLATGDTKTSPVLRKRVAKELTDMLGAAEAKALQAAAQHQQRADAITASLSAAASYKERDHAGK